MENILFIAYHFPPVGGAPVQRSLKFVSYLLGEGYRSIVISGPSKSKERYTPQDLKLINEIPPNISVSRVESEEPPERRGVIRRLQRFLLLPRPFAKWWTDEAIKLGEITCKNDSVSLIYATMSPFESANIASYLFKKYDIPWVADLRDSWVLDEIQAYASIIHKKVMLKKMHHALSTASVIVMNTPEATARLKRIFPDFCEKQVVTITNGFDPVDLNGMTAPRNDKKFQIVYVGHFLLDAVHNRRIHEIFGGAEIGINLGTRSPITLFKAIDKISQRYKAFIKDLEIVFVGNASDLERNFVGNSNISNVCRFTGYLPREEALKIVKAADLLFLPMHKLPPGKRSSSAPSKMYEYMASGRPILAAVPESDARDFLAKCGTALLCRPDDCDEMAHILIKLYESWEKGIKLISPDKKFLKRFERKHLAKILAREFDKLLMRK